MHPTNRTVGCSLFSRTSVASSRETEGGTSLHPRKERGVLGPADPLHPRKERGVLGPAVLRLRPAGGRGAPLRMRGAGSAGRSCGPGRSRGSGATGASPLQNLLPARRTRPPLRFAAVQGDHVAQRDHAGSPLRNMGVTQVIVDRSGACRPSPPPSSSFILAEAPPRSPVGSRDLGSRGSLDPATPAGVCGPQTPRTLRRIARSSDPHHLPRAS